LLYEQGSLDEAEKMVIRHLPTIKTAGNVESAVRAYPILARAASRHGRHNNAAAILEEAEDMAMQRGWLRLAAVSIAERANLLLENDHVADALVCADSLGRLAKSPGPSSSQSDIHRLWTLVRARVILAQGPSRGAVALLRQLQREALNRQDLYEALHLAIRLVDALEVIGEQSEALAVLLRALTLGSAVGVYQAFLDGGDRVERLLVQVYDHPPTSDIRSRGLLPYIGSLLDRRRACEITNPRLPSQPGSSRVLSERERLTLVWMSHGLSNKVIAKKLGVTPETIKSHAKNIFIKLTVKTRAEAVSRASGLGLI
jgi:ATP/maltotriose-dependent transcriptional regulator MalT